MTSQEKIAAENKKSAPQEPDLVSSSSSNNAKNPSDQSTISNSDLALQFAHGSNPESGNDRHELQILAKNWLDWQCNMISGVLCGALFLPEDNGELAEPLAQYPEQGTNLGLLTKAAVLTQSSSNNVIRFNQAYGVNKGQTCDVLACPLLIDDKYIAVVSLLISPRSKPQCHAVMQLLEWGMLWLKKLLQQESVTKREQGKVSLELLAVMLKHGTSKAAAIEVVNMLATHFGSERVSLGFCFGLCTHLKALSHVSHFNRDNLLIREIEAAMNEAIDQSVNLVYQIDTLSSTSVVQAHGYLAKQRGNGQICTMLLSGQSGYIGAITCEQGSKHFLDKERLANLESIARVVGPVIALMVKNERSLLTKSIVALRSSIGDLLGLSYLKLKLVLLSIFVLFSVLSMTQGMHEVKAVATLQGKIRQLLVAPQDGFIKKGLLRAGDLVKKDNVLATLDDRSLQLERQKWQSEKNKLAKQHQQAFSKRDRSQLAIIRAQIDQVGAEIALIDEKISRTKLQAPFDGVVISGDLSQSQGSPVVLGQVLFEITPLNSYRVMLEVDEHDIAHLQSGQTARLVMSALPQKTFKIILEKVIPVAISSDGYNYFRVQGQLDKPSALLRPGMHGVAKINIEPRALLWVWGHGVLDRLRLWLWSFGL